MARYIVNEAAVEHARQLIDNASTCSAVTGARPSHAPTTRTPT